MVPRIKRAIADYFGEKEWFFLVLKHGTWQYHQRLPGVTYHNRSYDEYRIAIGDLSIDITDLSNGRYRVGVGVPTTGGIHRIPRWRDTEFAHTSEADTGWIVHVHRILEDSERDLAEWHRVNESSLPSG